MGLGRLEDVVLPAFMPSRRLSAHARRLLADHVHSVLQLELVLLLARDPARAWTPADAAAELRAPEPWVGTRLAELTALDIVAPRDPRAEAYIFLADGPWATAIAEIAAQFAQRRTSMIKAIIGPR
jgi:hypothetical protein